MEILLSMARKCSVGTCLCGGANPTISGVDCDSEGSFVIFTKANDFLASRGMQPLSKVQLVGLTREA
jgi:hypothetical protein